MRQLLSGPASEVGPALLGAMLTAHIGSEITTVVITEVEAYMPDDPASHSYRGRTDRNASMFGLPGTLYVYRSYGIHWCMNVATGPAGEGAAVLLRSGHPVEGRSVMVARRGREDHLADGPGKLSQALGVTGQHDGLDLLADGPVRLTMGASLPFTATRRVGISKAVDLPWRWVAREPVISPRPSPDGP